MLNYAKIHAMHSHIAHQCEQAVQEKPQGRIEMIRRLESNTPRSSSRGQKHMAEVKCFIRLFLELHTVLRYLVSERTNVSQATQDGTVWITSRFIEWKARNRSSFVTGIYDEWHRFPDELQCILSGCHLRTESCVSAA